MFNWDLDVDLLALLPPWYREVLDYQQICNAESEQLQYLSNDIVQIDNNFYFQTMDESSVSRWEEIFEILPDTQTETLEFRRERLLIRIKTMPPFTLAFLLQKLDELIGLGKWKIDIDYTNYTINIELDYDRLHEPGALLREIMVFLGAIKPAHMRLWPAMLTESSFAELHNQRFVLRSLRLPFRIVNSSREIIRLNGERCLDGSWPLDQDVRSLIFQSMLVELAVREQERLSAAGAMRLQSRVSNSETLCWPQLEFGLRIGNLAFTRLNGERGLDGSWFLEQTAGGTELVSLEIQSGWQLENRAMTAGSLHSPGIKLTNKNKALEPRLQLNSWLANSNAVKQPELKLQSGWQEQNILGGGSLTRDTMWRLGGEAYLNGGKKLNAAIISENF